MANIRYPIPPSKDIQYPIPTPLATWTSPAVKHHLVLLSKGLDSIIGSLHLTWPYIIQFNTVTSFKTTL